MAPVIGLVTDSSSQITPELIEEFAIEVVPMTVTIDGTEHLEGEDLDADGFYDHFADGASPDVSTSQPAPARFAEAYERLAARGCTEIISLHLAASMSGTIASAELAGRTASIPVSVIDTGSASYGVAVCAWAAGVAIRRGGMVSDIERRVTNLVPRIATAFMVGVPHLTERGGRAAGVELDGDGIPVLAMSEGQLEVLDRVSTVADAIDVMATYATGWIDRSDAAGHRGVTVAIGTADAPSRPLAQRLRDALTDVPGIDAIVDYRIGPSVGAHTGPGTFGLFVFPTIR